LAVVAPFSLPAEPLPESAEPAEPVVSICVAAAEVPVCGTELVVSLAVVAPFSLPAEPVPELAEALVAVLSTAVVSAFALPVEPLVAVLSTAVVAPFSLPAEPVPELAEALVAVLSTRVVSALALPVEPLVATVSLATAVAPAPEAPLCGLLSPALVVLPLASPLVSFPLSWPVSSVALLPGEKVITSDAALRLLTAAGSAEGSVLGIAGTGFVGALVEMMTMRGVLAWWYAGDQVMLP